MSRAWGLGLEVISNIFRRDLGRSDGAEVDWVGI